MTDGGEVIEQGHELAEHSALQHSQLRPDVHVIAGPKRSVWLRMAGAEDTGASGGCKQVTLMGRPTRPTLESDVQRAEERAMK
jgi:hypothetical protein